MSAFMLYHTEDQGELQIVTHHAYCEACILNFLDEKEKDRFLELHQTQTSWPAVVSTSAFNSHLVDTVRALAPCDSTCARLYRATNRPHPALGTYVVVH